MELATVNPVAVFGPVLGADYATSILIVQKMLGGAMPGCPRLEFGGVDVRDVADLHLRAMTDAAAQGERFLAVAGDFVSLVEIGRMLKSRLGAAAKRVPTRELPDWLVRLASLKDPAVKQVLPELGNTRMQPARRRNGCWDGSHDSLEDAVVATAQSLLRLGLVKGVQTRAA